MTNWPYIQAQRQQSQLDRDYETHIAELNDYVDKLEKEVKRLRRELAKVKK